MAAQGINIEIGKKAPDFSLVGVDDKTYTINDCKGEKGLVVAFICNHCPYVIAVQKRLVALAQDLQAIGVGLVAINSNDAIQYPADDFASMKKVAKDIGYPFPYLVDETQQVAKAYDAACTPDFFGFNSQLELQYRGRMDESGKNYSPDAKRELYEAMKEISITGKCSLQQMPSLGCSIKWKK